MVKDNKTIRYYDKQCNKIQSISFIDEICFIVSLHKSIKHCKVPMRTQFKGNIFLFFFVLNNIAYGQPAGIYK